MILNFPQLACSHCCRIVGPTKLHPRLLLAEEKRCAFVSIKKERKKIANYLSTAFDHDRALGSISTQSTLSIYFSKAMDNSQFTPTSVNSKSLSITEDKQGVWCVHKQLLQVARYYGRRKENRKDFVQPQSYAFWNMLIVRWLDPSCLFNIFVCVNSLLPIFESSLEVKIEIFSSFDQMETLFTFSKRMHNTRTVVQGNRRIQENKGIWLRW